MTDAVPMPLRSFCSTEDGALGSALCVSGTRLAATAYDLHEYLPG